MRPAVNIPLSVTRVGRQTLDTLSRDVNRELNVFLSQYEKLQNISHFGQELTDDVKKKLKLGEMVYKFFSQPYQVTVPKIVQLIMLSLILQSIIENKDDMERVKRGLIAAFFNRGQQKILYELVAAHNLKEFNEKVRTNLQKIMALIQTN
jgi:F0F1-type ATP synthase alpha subunit